MRATGRWDDDAEAAASAWCTAAIDRAVAEVATAGAPPPEMLFDNVWADDPPGLAAQRAELLRDLP
jgi:TPP-dependent pyruvate/acetoin dehydrogenase alpha subunit